MATGVFMNDREKAELLKRVKSRSAKGFDDMTALDRMSADGLVKRPNQIATREDGTLGGYEVTPEGEKFIQENSK